MITLKPYHLPVVEVGRLHNILTSARNANDWQGLARWLCKAIALKCEKATAIDEPRLFRARIELTALAMLLNSEAEDAHREWYLEIARHVPGCFVVSE